MKWWRRQKLHTQVLIAAVLGVITGLILQENAAYLEPIGTIFIRLLQFLVVPLVIATLLSGILQMSSIKELGKVGFGFFGYLTISSLIAVAIGVGVAMLIRPGLGLDLSSIPEGESSAAQAEPFSFADQMLTWVPNNIFASLTEMAMIQIIIWTILFGIVMLSLGEQKIPRGFELVREASAIVLRLTSWIILLSPYGIFALLAALVGTAGANMLESALKFILADYIALIVVALVVYPLILSLFARLNPIRFYRNVGPAVLFAMSTASSSATIPVSMRVAEQNVGVPKKVFGFTIPFGATANMDGFAVALGVISVFAADAYNIPITFTSIAQFVVLGLVLSIGAAGVRGAGIIMTAVLLETLGMSLLIIPLIAAIYPLVDIGHTALNVTSDHVGTAVVGAKTKTMDRKRFNTKSAALDVAEDVPK